jgi:hypothetical protein
LEAYVHAVEDTAEWGGELEIRALVRRGWEEGRVGGREGGSQGRTEGKRDEHETLVPG